MEQVLHKVSISGGGRCNCMHDHRKPPKDIAQNYPRGQRELLGPLTSSFGPKETYEYVTSCFCVAGSGPTRRVSLTQCIAFALHSWFTQTLGVTLKTEADGRMFPVSDDSASIVEALRKAAAEAGVRVETGAKAR